MITPIVIGAPERSVKAARLSSVAYHPVSKRPIRLVEVAKRLSRYSPNEIQTDISRTHGEQQTSHAKRSQIVRVGMTAGNCQN